MKSQQQAKAAAVSQMNLMEMGSPSAAADNTRSSVTSPAGFTFSMTDNTAYASEE
mgnify:FL=1